MSLSYGFALKPLDTADEFSDALHALIGDGISGYGGRFEITLSNSFAVTLAPGFAFANGRYLKSTEPYTLTIPPSSNNADRDDAIAVCVDYLLGTVSFKVLVGIDKAQLQTDTSSIRNQDEYNIILYIVHVKRGATVIYESDVTDKRADKGLCGAIIPIDEAAKEIQAVYDYLNSGLEDEIDRIVGLANQVIQQAETAIQQIDTAIANKGQNSVGDVIYSRNEPYPVGYWLLCNGEEVPEGYETLNTMLGGQLPDMGAIGNRYYPYIYGGRGD